MNPDSGVAELGRAPVEAWSLGGVAVYRCAFRMAEHCAFRVLSRYLKAIPNVILVS